MGNPTAHTELSSIAQLPGRGRVLCRGYISAITIPPVNQAPEFSAIVTDVDAQARRSLRSRHQGKTTDRGTGGSRLRLIWLGQRQVPGIEAGTEVRFEGMVSQHQGLPTIFNPRYEIIGKPEFQQEAG